MIKLRIFFNLYLSLFFFNLYSFLEKSLLYSFPLPFSPLHPLRPSNQHTVVLVHEFFFLFAQSLHSLTTPSSTSCNLLSISESVSVLLVSSVCSLDSTYAVSYTHLTLPTNKAVRKREIPYDFTHMRNLMNKLN